MLHVYHTTWNNCKKINLPSFKNLCPFIDGFRLVRFKLELQML